MKHLFFVEQGYSIAILRPLAKAAIKRGDEVRWFLMDVPRPKSISEHMVLHTNAEAKSYAPDSVVAPGNWVPPSWSGIKVQIFHGFGIEKKGHFRIRGHFDLYCTPGPLMTETFEELANEHRHFKVVETGWPKMDPWSSGKVKPRRFKPPYRILYAPTFSPNLDSAPALLPYWKTFSANSAFKVKVKFHSLETAETVQDYQNIGGNLQVAGKSNILKMMSKADIAVSDTSSVVPEAIYLSKPVITFNAMRPGPHVRNFTDPSELEMQINAVIASIGEGHAPLPEASHAEKLIETMHPYHDGKSSERILDAIYEAVTLGTDVPKRKPLNLIRNRKIAKKMKKFS